ncbi:MAG: hypothetical protein NTU88_11140 [Armatimonadetes bacterium]|nr:hypothetical protein [Armatimonadota bacterium]
MAFQPLMHAVYRRPSVSQPAGCRRYPFNPVMAMPSVMRFWKIRNAVMTGIVHTAAAGMVNRDLGGAALGLIPGITGGAGLNNVGLLVRAWGKVKYIGSDYFNISDGYGIGGQSYREIKVRCPGLTKPSSTSQYAVVSGISSLELSGSTAIPTIRVRKQTDLVYYTP